MLTKNAQFGRPCIHRLSNTCPHSQRGPFTSKNKWEKWQKWLPAECCKGLRPSKHATYKANALMLPQTRGHAYRKARKAEPKFNITAMMTEGERRQEWWSQTQLRYQRIIGCHTWTDSEDSFTRLRLKRWPFISIFTFTPMQRRHRHLKCYILDFIYIWLPYKWDKKDVSCIPVDNRRKSV